MITLSDLDAAIAECLGERNPDAKTCQKLAAFYVIKDHMYGDESRDRFADASKTMEYSNDAPSLRWNEFEDFGYQSDTEFAEIASKTDKNVLMAVIDELMSVLQATNPRLYKAAINRLLDT